MRLAHDGRVGMRRHRAICTVPFAFAFPTYPAMFSRSKRSPEGATLSPDELRASRRRFLFAGTAALAAPVVLAACDGSDDDDDFDTVNLGSGDTGVLNYAYALEQLEAAFYIQAVANPYSGITQDESDILRALRDHEIVHREFFAAALGSDAIPALTPDFSGIDFSSRASVLGTASTFEDLGVSAYNGAGKLFQNTDFLTIAGKIVSVEARHASAIRSLLSPGTAAFAGDDVVDPDSGLGLARTPTQVLSAAGSFITERINFSDLPTAT